MTKLSIVGRALFAALVLIALSACTIFSQTPLVGDAETTTPLDPAFALMFYSDSPEGNYVKGDDDPQPFTLTGTSYEAGDKSMVARFVPLEGNQYLVAVDMQGGNLYGVARIFENHVFELHLVLDGEYEAAIKEKLGSAPADIAGSVTVSEGGIEVKSRPALDFFVQLLQSGEIGEKPMVGFIAASATDAFPSAIAKDGDGWTVTN